MPTLLVGLATQPPDCRPVKKSGRGSEGRGNGCGQLFDQGREVPAPGRGDPGVTTCCAYLPQCPQLLT